MSALRAVDVDGVTWRSTFETGDFSEWDQEPEFVGDGIRVVNDPTRGGTQAAAFLVAPGDDPIGDDGERAELRRSSFEGEGVESAWAWSTFFPAGFAAESGAGTWTMFFHFTIADGAEGCRPPLQLDVAPDGTERLRMVVRGGPFLTDAVSCETPESTKFLFEPLERDRWYDFVLLVRWSEFAETGAVALWIDNEEVVPLTNIATLYPGAQVAPKLGLYRSPSSVSSEIVHDELRRGTRVTFE